MKTKSIALLVALILSSLPASAQYVINDFSNVEDGVNTFFGTWAENGDTFSGDQAPVSTFVQGTGVFSVTGAGVTDASSSYVEIYGPEPLYTWDLSAFDGIELTAEALGDNQATALQVYLIDEEGDTALASFESVDFVTGASHTVQAAWTPSGLFDSAAVQIVRITGGNALSAVLFSVNFDQLSAVVVSAVPEPSTYATLLGLMALGVVWQRRRRGSLTV